MSDAAQKRKEDARREVRGWLAERQALKFEREQIRRRLNAEGNDFADAEVRDALVFLMGKHHVEMSEDGDGSTPYYQASSEGVLAHERRFS